MARYFVRRKEHSISFDITVDEYNGVRNETHTYYYQDMGGSHWFGGIGTLAAPESFYSEMKEYEVSREEFDKLFTALAQKEER